MFKCNKIILYTDVLEIAQTRSNHIEENPKKYFKMHTFCRNYIFN